MKFKDIVAKAKNMIAPKPAGVFIPEVWAKDIMDKMRGNITLMGIDMAQELKPEPICPITKALIVQQLSDLCVKHPGVSLREIISIALQDGVKDDYEFAQKLEGVSQLINMRSEKTGTQIKIRTMHATRKMQNIHDDATDALRALVDNAMLANLKGQSAVKIVPKHVQSVDCSGPAGKNGSDVG